MARYKVIGVHEVLGHEPGDEFYADLEPIAEARLVAGGHIARALEPDAPKPSRSVEKNEKKDEKVEQHDENENDEESPDEA